jgi:phospholipase C
MKCFAPEQLPVLIALAQEFAVCDNWHASLPGPTWPNRMFVHAASSGGLDHSPTTEEIVEWETIGGFQFKAGSIFDALKSKGVSRRLYAGDDFPMVAALKGISLFDIRHYSNFASDLGQSTYPYSYVFIEPSYDVLNDYKNSTSQHPLTDITLGEGLIKETYEAIRNSPHWNNSVLIITWDEHGGFYDHAIPAGAVEPGDTAPQDKRNQYGFTFQQYGPRVPAVVISPLVPKNVVDHRLYDHGSIPATIEAFFSTILQRVSAPLKKADLLVVAHYLIGHLTYSQVPALAKRHKVEVKNESGSAQEVLTKQVSKYDESELCKLLLEVSLWDSACQRPTTSGNDILLDSANRYRVDAEKLQKAIAEDWDANRAKKRKNKVKTRC